VKFTGVQHQDVWLLVTATSAIVGAAIGLCVVDRIGRRSQMLTGLAGMGVGNLMFLLPALLLHEGHNAAKYTAVCGLQVALFSFSAGVAPAFFAAVTEIWPNRCV
jgi:MFS family permease